MAKILVTGGAGFIGINLLEELLPHYDIAVVDNLSTSKGSPLLNDVHFYKMNILEEDFEKIVAQERPDFIIHLAAQIKVSESFVRPVFDLESNILGTLKVIEAAKKKWSSKINLSFNGCSVRESTISSHY